MTDSSFHMPQDAPEQDTGQVVLAICTAHHADEVPEIPRRMSRRVLCINEARLHAGHRRRLRARFTSCGANRLASHELLELMLTYAMPRVDVNPLAHRLLERFGTLNGVLSATPEELMSVPGVGEQTVCLLSLFSAVRTVCTADTEPLYMDKISTVMAYVRPLFAGISYEKTYLLLLDNRRRLIDCCLLSEGSISDTCIPVRRAAELCLLKHASGAILVHNHPHGSLKPSVADTDMTRRMEVALNAIGVTLTQHIIVSDTVGVALIHDRESG